MFLERFAQYVMRGRTEAAFSAFTWTLLGFFGIPLFAWIGLAILALVTLRKGALEGLLILLWIALPALALLFWGRYLPFLYSVVGGGLLTWIFALILREKNSWALVLQVGALLGIVAVLLVYILIPDINGFWLKTLKAFYSKDTTWQLSNVDLNTMVTFVAKIATGMQVFFLLCINFLCLLGGRYLQALLYNPGGLKPELLQIRLGWLIDLLLVVPLIGIGLHYAWGYDVLFILVGIFFLAGLSLFHQLISNTQHRMMLKILFYTVIILVFPYSCLVVALMALADTWVNFRKFLT